MQPKKNPPKKPATTTAVTTDLSGGRLFLLAAAIVLATFLSFSPAAKNSFINWDDNGYVFENSNLAKPVPQAAAYFFGPHYFIGNYIPLTMIVYTLEYHAAGLKPALYHHVNIFIHLLNVVLIFWFMYLLSGKRAWVAAIVALFSGIHPTHVESVAWVAELKDVLYTCFFMMGLISYYNHLKKKQAQPPKSSLSHFPWAALVFFILSVLSKPAAVTFPFVLLLLDFYTGRTFNKRLWLEKLPFFTVAFIFGLIAIQAQQADRLLHYNYTFMQRLLFASHSFIAYLAKLFLPVNLAIFYPYPQMAGSHLPYSYYIAPVLVALLFYGIYKTLKYSRLITFGFLFFFVNIVPVLQLITVGDAIMADRYTYMPFIGLLFILAMGFDKFYHSKNQKLNNFKQPAVAILLVLATMCSYSTYARCKVWQNDDTIATDLLNKFPNDWLALNNKGFILFTQGKYEESVKHFARALQIKADYTRASINLANAYTALNDYDNALKTTDTALTHTPQDYNLLNKKGYLLFQLHRYNEAVKFYNKAILLKKESVGAYINLAECYYTLKDYDKAIQIADAGLKYNPDDYILLNNKGYLLLLGGKYTQAADCFRASLKIKPDYTTASVNLSNCYNAMADTSKTKN